MKIAVYKDKTQMSAAAADKAAEAIRTAITTHGEAVVVFAAASSQIEFLELLTTAPGIDWQKVVMMQLDEYIGVDAEHPASFRRFLNERVVRMVRPGETLFIRGENPDPVAECERLNEVIGQHPVDVSLVGIGENGHLAFNDPPADFEAVEPYAVVELDEACRNQQAGEGWFQSISDVPRHAISMSISQIMASRVIVCTVPDARKREAVSDCLSGDVSPMHPASILQQHHDVHVYLDAAAAGDLFVAERRGQW